MHRADFLQQVLRAGRILSLLSVSAAFLAGWGSLACAAEKTKVASSPPETVLFPFDDHALPFNKGLVLRLLPGARNSAKDSTHPNKPVLNVGKKGDPDDRRVYFSGTVLFIDGEFRMWYAGLPHGGKRQICYAVSRDGLNWIKPKLGLATFKGSKDNNLPAIDGDKPIEATNCLVLHEPEDPNPERRFKMVREVAVSGRSWPVYVSFSPDGLNWKSAAGSKPINKVILEPSGLTKFNGAYYLNGHSSAILHPLPGAHKRTMQTFVSYDFENWTSAAHLSFRRDNVPPRLPTDFEGARGEQVHLGASLWNRGNVVLGFYGQYHNPTNDRRTSICDIGLVVSNDALHFREPVPDFKIVASFEEPDRAEPRLTQGQAFQNVGNKTYFWYGIWTEVERDGPTGVRVAMWARDRFGHFSVSPDIVDAHCISAPLTLARKGAKVYLNAAGLSADAQLQVEILDEQFRPVPGYSAADFIPFKQKSGFRLPVVWRGNSALGDVSGPFRIRVNFIGRDIQRARLFAIYIQ